MDFATNEEEPGRETFAGPGDLGTQREPLEPTLYGPPRTGCVTPMPRLWYKHTHSPNTLSDMWKPGPSDRLLSRRPEGVRGSEFALL